jgi:hypothetical protein
MSGLPPIFSKPLAIKLPREYKRLFSEPSAEDKDVTIKGLKTILLRQTDRVNLPSTTRSSNVPVVKFKPTRFANQNRPP